MFYKHFEVYMHNREPVIVTGKSRSQVGRDFKRIYGHDAVDEVKPISGRSVESRYGFEYKQIVKANTMVNTPEGNTPYINEETMETKNYAFYEVSFVGTDEKDIVIGASLEDVQADMQELYGENLDTVKPVQGEELVSDDPTDPIKNHERNVSILTGRNPFAESLNPQAAPMAARIKTNPARPQLSQRKNELRQDISAARAQSKSRNEETTPDKVWECGDVYLTSDMDLEEVKQTISYLPKELQQEAREALGIEEKRGLWDNIHAKRKRIKAGSGEKMRKPGSDGAPSDQDFKDSQKEEVEKKNDEVVAENQDKLMFLARVGLMDKNELLLLRRAMAQKSSGKPISHSTRNILFKLLDKMISMVVGNSHMFNMAKRKAMSEAMDEAFGELQEKDLTEYWVKAMDSLQEAGYMDQPKTKAEVKKKYPDIETDVKNKDSIEVQSVKYK